jgi:D-methionine transport system ATP-binding protein
LIEFRQVSKVFDSGKKKVEALKEINLTVEKGDIFGVIGFSGAGKSTLIRTVNLLEYPTSGEIIVEGRNLAKMSPKKLSEAKKNIGMNFQHFNLLNSKTVYDNLAMPLQLGKKKKKEIENRVYEVLRFVGLEDKAKNYPNQLSGGQKQRVGIARALVTNPSILLCDEATSSLDPQTTISILKLLKRINEEYKITILMITHEMEVIKDICNRVAVMEEGRVIEFGNVFDIFARPKTVTTRNFVRSVVRDEVPASLYRTLEDHDHLRRIFKIDFLGVSTGQPIISKTAKHFDVEINVLFGNVIELQGIPFGNLIVELIGDHDEVERALQFIENQNVEVKEVTRDGNQHTGHSEGSVGYAVHG